MPVMEPNLDAATLKAQARRTRPDPQELERAAAIIAKAERPLLLVGGGIHISEAYDALLALAENFGIPVAHTMSGKGGIACTHPLSAGLFGHDHNYQHNQTAFSGRSVICGLGGANPANTGFCRVQQTADGLLHFTQYDATGNPHDTWSVTAR